MSRTDKDVPYRVHVAREGVEAHDHRFGGCDFEPRHRPRSEWERLEVRGWHYRVPCRLQLPMDRYAYTLRYYSRSKLQGWYASEYYDRDGARLRRELSDIKKLHRAGEDIESEEVFSPQHRHWAEWEVW